ncbi:unnamed protein product [Psylliodes chrysocephalus]|uniref:Uncharacterized protein n=1 Tax=Psylliodes chrysocephalus TaxID=3402493 RepID=A0A9P0GGS9_9CUCU|nr:unnamed protein product [Psylliodes chrysocephala]
MPGTFYVSDQFITLIRVTKKKEAPYLVRELTHKDFIDVKQLTADIDSNFTTNSNGESVLLRKIKMIKVEKHKPFLYFYKTSTQMMEAITGKPLTINKSNVRANTKQCS